MLIRFSFLRKCKAAILNQAVNALWYSHTANGEGYIHEAHVEAVRFIKEGVPKLFLDASAADCIIKAVSPDCRMVDIAVRRNVELVQISDSAMSYRRLREDNGYLSSQILELAFRLHSEGGQGAVIAPKEWMDKHGHRLPAGVITGHYGTLRGLNAMENADWLIQVGRCEPPPYAVERAVRAWFPTDPLIGAATREQAELRDKSGHGAIVQRTSHDDPRCVELLQSSREQESLQALDRLRLVHHTGKPKRVYLLSNLPLPGAVPDHLTTFDDLTLPGRLAEVMVRDGALVINKKYLAEKHSGIFKNAVDAKAAVKEWRNTLRGRFSYIDINRGFSPSSLVNNLAVIDYRTAKQIGGSPRQAILYSNLDAQSWLTHLHGETVKSVSARPLTPAPEAPPMNPTPAEIAPHTPEPELPTALETEIAELNEVSEPVMKLSTAPVIQVEAPEPAVIRAVAWTVIFNDGHTATLRDPDRPTIDAALIVAQRLMPGAVRVQAIH